VWFHGGGWVIGTLDDADLTCRELAQQAGCAVISVEYRLAPETPFPGAFNDCLAVTEWVLDSGPELNIDPARVAVGGDSAGGNLAACVAVAARDRGHELALQLLVYPIIAADFTAPSYELFATGYHLLRNDMLWSWNHYTEPHQRRDPRVSPIEADLTGVAPVWLFAAEADVLVDEGRRYAEALQHAGVPVERCEMAGTIHGAFTQRFACSVEARALAAGALRQAFGS
jgi:acetyl esterase